MDPSADTTRTRRSLVPRWFVASGLSAVAMLAAALLLPPVLDRPATVQVPNVQGLDVSVARSRLAQAGFLLEIGDTRFSASATKGSVLEQRPGPGESADVGSAVAVVLSAGSEQFSLPDVIGMRVEEATSLLEGRGLIVGVDAVVSDEPTGTVLSSVPGPGATIFTSEMVRLTVSADKGDASVPLRHALSGQCFVIDPGPMPAVAATTAPSTDAPMEVARRLRSLLEASGAGVSITRSMADTAGAGADDVRARRAAEVSCTAVVGLAVSGSTPGLAVVTIAPRADDPRLYIPSSDLSQAILEALRASRLTAIGVTVEADAVLSAVPMPGVRVRLGAVSSPADRTAFRDPSWFDAVARSIYGALGEEYGK